MVKALGLFLEGGYSLRNWWITQGREGQNVQQANINEATRRGVTFSEQADREFGIQDLPDTCIGESVLGGLRMGDLDSQPGSRQSGAPSMTGDGRPPIPSRLSSSTIGTTVGSTDLASPGVLQEHTSITSDSAQGYMSKDGTRHDFAAGTSPETPNQTQQPSILGKHLQEALLSDDLKRTFGRASNLIREAIDVDGVAFFDASVGSFGAASEKSNMNAKAPGAHTINTTPVDTTTSSSEENRRSDTSDGDPTSSEPVNHVSVLGYSTRTRSSVNKHSSLEAQYQFTEPLLRQLAKKYPHGKIFSFDEHGSISSSDGESHHQEHLQIKPRPETIDNLTRRKKKKKMSIEEESAGILKIVPGARSVAWFPLWHPALERWYASAIIWSISPVRVFSPEEELTYMVSISIDEYLERLTIAGYVWKQYYGRSLKTICTGRFSTESGFHLKH
jgi:hypothetical protein